MDERMSERNPRRGPHLLVTDGKGQRREGKGRKRKWKISIIKIKKGGGERGEQVERLRGTKIKGKRRDTVNCDGCIKVASYESLSGRTPQHPTSHSEKV